MEIWKPKLGEYKAPSSLCLWQYPLEVSYCSRKKGIGQHRRRLELYYQLCISVVKIRWKLQLERFSYDKKNANVVMWKDKTEYEYISTEINSNKELTILRFRNVSRKKC